MLKSPKQTTIVFPVRNSEVLLGMKKRGFGEGWWNGFGGKLEPNESFEENARRETYEEAGITLEHMGLAALLLFYFGEELKVVSKAFISSKFTGSPIETEEMRPRWFNTGALPYESMWPSDKIWVPIALKLPAPKEALSYSVYFSLNNKLIDFKPINISEAQRFFELS